MLPLNLGKFPTSWFDPNASYLESRDWHYETVFLGSKEGHEIVGQFLESMTEGIVVSSIRRIHHSLLLKRFAERRNEVMVKNNDNGNVQRLWHGTSGTPCDQILSSESGLDVMRSSKGFYGKGIYLAEHARYSNGDKNGNTGRDYFTANPETGERELLLVLATCGHSKEFGDRIKKSLNPATDLKDDERSTKRIEIRYDSVRGGPHRPSISGRGDNDSEIYVVYDNRSVYPAYVVSFKKEGHGVKTKPSKKRKRSSTQGSSKSSSSSSSSSTSSASSSSSSSTSSPGINTGGGGGGTCHVGGSGESDIIARVEAAGNKTTKNYDNGVYYGQMEGGERHGYGTYTFASGNKYVGEWKKNKMDGNGTHTWANGNKYVGEWKNDKKDGNGTYTYPDGKKYVGEWKNGKRHGQGTFTLANGTIHHSGEWVNGSPKK